jgi:hypothetical protein
MENTENNENNDQNDDIDVYNEEIDANFQNNSEDTNISSKIDKNLENKEKKHTRKCPYCKQDYETKVGMKNWKNLFRKPTMDDWIVLIILILLMAASYAYVTETKACKEVFTNATKLDQICLLRQNQLNYTWNGVPDVPLLNYTIVNETENMVGDDTDEYGCKPSAGYSWCNVTQKCIRSWEENCSIEVTGTDVNITINNSNVNSSNVSG